jgi:hypothetical protein
VKETLIVAKKAGKLGSYKRPGKDCNLLPENMGLPVIGSAFVIEALHSVQLKQRLINWLTILSKYKRINLNKIA